jgi:hypothetical protein
VLLNVVIARISPCRIVYTASAGCGFPDLGLTRQGWLSSLTVRIAYSFAHNLNNTLQHTLSNVCNKEHSLLMHFITPIFFVLQEELYPSGRPFVLSYSVTQDLVSCNHFLSASRFLLDVTDEIDVAPESLRPHDQSCFETTSAFDPRSKKPKYGHRPVSRSDRLIFYNQSTFFPFLLK